MDEHNFSGALSFEDIEKLLKSLDETETPTLEASESSIGNSEVQNLSTKNSSTIDYENLNAFELLNFNITETPKLVEPFFQKVGLASLVGTSDAGKSMFLRHLSLCIVLGLDNFIGFKLNTTSKNVLYLSTEDDHNSVSFTLRSQILKIIETNKNLDLQLLNNLEFAFNSDDFLAVLINKLKTKKYDLVVIDAFADIYTREINANTQVRQFLNLFDKLSKKYNTLIVFLHHTGKRTNYSSPNKDNIIGSQAFEAKMRAVIELRPSFKADDIKELWILKANFLANSFKKNSYKLNLTKDLVFENTGLRGSKLDNDKKNNPEIIEKVTELHKSGKSLRAIETELKNTEFEIGKSSIAIIVKNLKK